MKAWFKIRDLRSKIGIITDTYLNYFELQDIETKIYYIIHESKVTFIN